MIDLQPFCGSATHIPAKFRSPWHANDSWCATDGRIGIIVDAPGEPDTPATDGEPFPPLHDIIAGHRGKLAMLTGERVELPKCEKCGGSGTIPCPHCEQDMPCKCKDRVSYFRIAPGQVIRQKYADLILALPNVKVVPRSRPLRFVFDGGHGAVTVVVETEEMWPPK